jgi:spermidine synthase
VRALAAAALAGFGVMAAEILASRRLAPAFGASLTSWAALISVTLLLGAAGAYAGGRLARRRGGRDLGGAFLLAAGGSLAGLLGPGVVDALVERPPLLGALLASGALLGPVVVPLSAALPIAAASVPRGITGEVVGSLVAASTLGSLAGTLGAALVLVPDVGLARSAALLAAVHGGAGLLFLRGRGPAAALLLAGTAGALALPAGARDAWVRETAHGRVEVRRTATGGEVRVDGILQGAGSPLAAAPGSLLRARQHAGLLPWLHPRATTALQVGLGAGVLAKGLQAYGIEVESVEANPALLRLAREALGYDGVVHLDDGRRFLRLADRRFDLVLLDAFQGEALPAHLVTREALALARERLAPGGILYLHLIGRPAHAVTASVAATLRAVFPHVLATRSGVEDELQDLHLFASDVPLRVPPAPELLALGWRGDEPFDPPAGGLVLTDDRNPIDRMNEPLARALRRASRFPRTGRTP